jgi:phosphatidylglycerophosphate synthase
MAFIALLSIGETVDGSGPGAAVVGGISIVERQVRQSLRAGASGVLMTGAVPEPLATRLSAVAGVTLVASAAALAQQLRGLACPVLALSPGLVMDDRLVAVMARTPAAPALLVFAGAAPRGAERLDASDHWAGAVRLPAELVARVVVRLGEWDLASTLARVAVEQGASRIAVDTIDTYAPERRRHVPMLWRRPANAAECRTAERELLAAAQKGCLDWPARFIHAPIEDAIVLLLLPTRITPNMVTLLALALGVAAVVAFAVGGLWPGLVLMLLVGPIDGVDGKMARVCVEYSRWGDLEHVADKIVEYGAWIALGYWFSTQGYGISAWMAAFGIIIFSISEAIKGEFFRRFTGRQLDDWGPFERRFRLIAGRRNIYFWTLLAFAACDFWFAGFLMVLGWATFTFCIAEWRFLRALRAYGRETDARVAANFAATAYDFLPKASAGGR